MAVRDLRPVGVPRRERHADWASNPLRSPRRAGTPSGALAPGSPGAAAVRRPAPRSGWSGCWTSSAARTMKSATRLGRVLGPAVIAVRRAGVRGGPGQGGCQEGDSPVDQASVVAERGAGEDQGEPGDCPRADPERDGDQSRPPRDRRAMAQAAAVTTTLTMSMTVYPCGNVTAAPDPWMLLVSAGRKETAGRRAPGAWRGQPGRACTGLTWSRPGFGCQRGSSDCPSWESAVRLPGRRAADRALTATLGRRPSPGIGAST